MFLRLEGFVALAKQKNPVIVFTHCLLYREALISKSLVPKLKKVLDKTIKTANYIKSRQINLKSFQHYALPWNVLTPSTGHRSEMAIQKAGAFLAL